jgi:hypothetical protein
MKDFRCFLLIEICSSAHKGREVQLALSAFLLLQESLLRFAVLPGADPVKSRLGLARHHNLDGLLDHVQSRFFGIGFADWLFALAVAR